LETKIVVFKIIVINEIIRLGNEIIVFGIVAIIVQGQPIQRIRQNQLSKDDHMKN
jgi:hypothetical protein